MSSLIELAERAEGLSGPDREMDALVWVAVHGGYIEHNGHIGSSSRRIMWCDDKGLVKHPVALGDGLWRERRSLGTVDAAPKLTASTDAVFSLIAEKLPEMVVENLGEMRDSGSLTGHWLAQLGPRGPRRRLEGPITARSLQATLDASPLTSAATPALALLSAALHALANTQTSRVAPLSASPQTSDDGPGMPTTSISKDQTP